MKKFFESSSVKLIVGTLASVAFLFLVIFLFACIAVAVSGDDRPTAGHDYAGRECVETSGGALALRNGGACVWSDCPNGGFGCGFGA